MTSMNLCFLIAYSLRFAIVTQIMPLSLAIDSIRFSHTSVRFFPENGLQGVYGRFLRGKHWLDMILSPFDNLNCLNFSVLISMIAIVGCSDECAVSVLGCMSWILWITPSAPMNAAVSGFDVSFIQTARGSAVFHARIKPVLLLSPDMPLTWSACVTAAGNVINWPCSNITMQGSALAWYVVASRIILNRDLFIIHQKWNIDD